RLPRRSSGRVGRLGGPHTIARAPRSSRRLRAMGVRWIVPIMNAPKLLSFYARVALFVAATATPLGAAAPPGAHAVLDASKDAVWDATVASLTDSGYRIRTQNRDRGTLTARRTRSVGRLNEQEATQELRQITLAEPRRGVVDARGMSEYH